MTIFCKTRNTNKEKDLLLYTKTKAKKTLLQNYVVGCSMKKQKSFILTNREVVHNDCTGHKSYPIFTNKGAMAMMSHKIDEK